MSKKPKDIASRIALAGPDPKEDLIPIESSNRQIPVLERDDETGQLAFKTRNTA